jgi:hypothetical protein
MSVKFNDDLNHTIIVEDVMSDEENNDEFLEREEFQPTLDRFNLVKEEEIQNEVYKPNIQYRKMSPYHNTAPNQKRRVYPSKNQISYDDILTSMNMCVKNGKLERIQSVPQEENYAPQIPYQHNGQPNSYIYNKYFKNYAQQQQEQQIPSRPLTQEERRILMIKRQIEIAQQRKRISEIKSTKLQFSDNNVNVSSVYRHKDLNRLFKMKF